MAVCSMASQICTAWSRISMWLGWRHGPRSPSSIIREAAAADGGEGSPGVVLQRVVKRVIINNLPRDASITRSPGIKWKKCGKQIPPRGRPLQTAIRPCSVEPSAAQPLLFLPLSLPPSPHPPPPTPPPSAAMSFALRARGLRAATRSLGAVSPPAPAPRPPLTPHRSRSVPPSPRCATCRSTPTSPPPCTTSPPPVPSLYVPLFRTVARRTRFRTGLLTICWGKQFKVQLHADSFHSYRCDAPPPETTVTKDELINMYRTMVRLLGIEESKETCLHSRR